MKIEDAISQTKPFASPFHKALVNLFYTAHHFQYLSNEQFKNYDLSWQQFNALRILRGSNEPLNINQIKERLIDKNCDVSRLIDRLEKKQFTKRMHCPNDLRKSNVHITENGLKLLNKIEADPGCQPHDLCRALSVDEATQLSLLLDKLRD